MAATIVSVINQKGGTGKTTTTINLGSALQKLGKRVLLIDLDPQANLSYSLGITEPSATLAEVFAGKVKLTDCLQETNGLFVVPGSNDLVDVEISLVNHEERERFLQHFLEEVTGFDYILIDCPPSLSLLTVNALSTSHEVLIPLQMEVLTLQGLGQILNTVQQIKKTLNAKLKVKGIVVVMYDKRRKLSAEIEDYLKENIDEYIFQQRIRLNVKLAEAPSFGQSVLDYDASSYGAKDYLGLAKEFVALP
ncbi:ParA family protein [Rufibacter glacialis]|uniref:AAA family ATPase n=1 Tax=Rufibacter glacialis TaxID=1259555 RepID=A0A5M8QAE3_9BACT|nr:ParA family protein [Rufibacter glacialis]KAA6431796.1 AAA family ATPase [Rufibacter glacialis]GGK81495.1 chromosome partitioning protein ParA [Rufibacter glacialis]